MADKSRFKEYLEKVIPEGTYTLGQTSKEIKTLPQGGAGSDNILIEIKGNEVLIEEGSFKKVIPFQEFQTFTTPNGLKPYEILMRNKVNLADYAKDQNPPIDFLINQSGQLIRKNPGT